MLQHNLKKFVYQSSTEEKQSSERSKDLDTQTIEKLLQSLANQSMRETAPSLEELESILQRNIDGESSDQTQTESDQFPKSDDTKPITKYLLEHGYLKDEKNWLTKKGFLAIGNQILKDMLAEIKAGDFGLHETKSIGTGNTILDTTKKFELGGELKLLNVYASMLNTIRRLSKKGKTPDFPLDLDIDDFEEFETTEDVRAAIVYCIDLSSTMKSSLSSSGMSRIEAAKRALWSLYVLNNRFFPNDSIKIIGFASMASMINPFDIPFLRTYDANDEFLHYTNYQAAFRLAKRILQKTSAKNKRIVMITDGQPSACFVDNDSQKNAILSEKPHSNFYVPNEPLLSKIKSERKLAIDQSQGAQVYLCYRYKKVDSKVDERTMLEAKKCLRENIQIDSIVVSEESELLEYVQQMEKTLKGKTYLINQNNMDKVLVIDYLYNTKKILGSKN
ncbi:MAG: VWA domain-containing protein [Thaumarchaeota archaeon]|nr:VWA domain-containing protein [Nitrososphaerota archaeon]